MDYYFIDTNLFYEIIKNPQNGEDFLFFLEDLKKRNDKLLLPQQILDELYRKRFSEEWGNKENKEEEIRFLGELRKNIRKNVDKTDYRMKTIKNIEKKIKELQKQNKEHRKKLQTINGKIDIVINKIKKHAIFIEDADEILLNTQKRQIKGNPPLESLTKDRSCDRYIWESLMYYFRNNKEKIKRPLFYFYTQNYKDFCVKDINDEWIFHPFLIKEFKEEFGGKINWNDNLETIPKITFKMKKIIKEVKKKEKEELEKRKKWYKLQDKYYDLREERSNYLKNFFSVGWEDEKLEVPKKILNREELEKIKKMDEEIFKAKKAYRNFLHGCEAEDI